ncbi:MAG: AAA family ATPase [Muribaculaceae bacterium]|nr:AAA family ATPase [Muribaculaceae bacterium]
MANINKKEHIEHYRNKLSSIYSNFKSSAEHIRLVFLTGVSRFGKLSVFYDLNNLRDISFLDDYADICGITEKELIDNFKTGISKLADKEGIDFEESLHQLKRNYDGYRFAKNGSDIYNPWSLLNAMADSDRLGIPNNEVKDGLFKVLLPYYVKSQSDKEEKRLG